MHIQNTDGTSGELTVDSAADRLAGLFSAGEDEDPQHSEPQSDDDVSDEPSDDDTEPASPDEEPDETDDEPNDEPETPKTFRLKVNGEEVEVTLDELQKGYSRTADYTRKTQELANQRKAAEAEFQAVRAERQRYSQTLTQLEQIVQQSAGAEPDWETLSREDPEEFNRQFAVHQLKKQRLDAIREEQNRVAAQEQAAQREERQKYLAEQRDLLLEKIPAWKDDAVAKREKAEIVAYTKEQGFSDADLAQITDHRALLMLRKAMLYDKAQKNKPNVQKKIATVMATKPGTPGKPSSREVTELTRSRQRLARTGRVEDAADVIERVMFRGKK